jgi:hypothetical protein
VSSHGVDNDRAVDRDRRIEEGRVADVDREFVSRDRPVSDVVRTREVGDTAYEDDLVTRGTTTKRY